MAEGGAEWGDTSDEDNGQNMEYQEVRYNKRKKKSSLGDGSDCEHTKHTRSEAIKEMSGKEIKVIITFAKQTEQQAHPVKLSKIIEKEIGVVKAVSCLSNGRIMIKCMDQKQKEKIMKMKMLAGARITCTEIGNKVQGVISGVPLNVSMDDIKGSLSGGAVISARRLQMWKDNKKCESMSVMIQFEGINLPIRVKLGFVSFSVREYVPPPLRCFKCQRMGHTASVCKGKMRCAKCGGEHDYGKCEEGAEIKCCNCGGRHSAAYAGCPVQQEAREVQKIKTVQHLTYAEATRKVKGAVETKRTNVQGTMAESFPQKDVNDVRNKPDQHVVMNKIDFVAFICAVVNGTSQVERKSDKIKIVVGCANKFLKLAGVTAEEVHEILKAKEGNVALDMTQKNT